MRIESYTPHHLEAVLGLALRAWEPVFESLQAAMDADMYRTMYPDGWRDSQKQAVEDACTASDMNVWVAVEADAVVGFVAVKCDTDSRLGEIHMIAVDPKHQRQGIGAALTAHALTWMKGAGMSIAMVETGGDPGHAPARQTYEKLGFRVLPIARYFKKL